MIRKIAHRYTLISSNANFDRVYLFWVAALYYLVSEQQRYCSDLIEPRCEKRVFGVSDQVPHKPGCTATEDG